MIPDTLKRDFTFSEWCALSFDDKRTIWNHHWNPFEPELGKATREAIVNEFRSTHPDLENAARAIGFGYFGHYVGCLYVIVDSGKTAVPKKFADLIVNKGVVREGTSIETILVDWRDVGGSKSKFNLKKRTSNN
jgi:hypothetical protein